MSGGSYNYACFAADDLQEALGHIDDFNAIAERLERTGHREAANAVRSYISRLDDFEKETNRIGAEIMPILKAVEWVDSGDWTEESVDQYATELSWKRASE